MPLYKIIIGSIGLCVAIALIVCVIIKFSLIRKVKRNGKNRNNDNG